VALAGLVPELGHRLVDETEAVGAPLGSWVIVSWSQEIRSVIWVPTASTRTAGWGRSVATEASDTTTAIEPAHGTSQS
jgi:hypothetical protein